MKYYGVSRVVRLERESISETEGRSMLSLNDDIYKDDSVQFNLFITIIDNSKIANYREAQNKNTKKI
jgi:hypothetical protein